uniref:Integrase catalytic domain-containing protein n=1 Tax=Panagrolaimus sp. PS1159 TaxID=55785 RepID=A0AC35EQK9_9BILA
MPNLPSNRVNITKPFQNIGIDYCGPFKVKGNKEKVWISLFTCFTTRLIHLEPVTSLNSEDFLFAFRRFVSRRGVPCYILSDNAKQFKTTATTLDELWNATIKDDNTVKYCNENLIVWDYITERAPWKGGLYERMVGLVKNALKQTIGRRFINFVEFWTFLCEVEATINSRPLTYIHAKEPFVIRPIDFISPGIQMELPTVSVDNENNDSTFLPAGTGGGERLFEHYKKTSVFLDKFWNLWNKDYLNYLRERNGCEHKNNRSSIKRQPKLNETVLVYENDTPRGLWKKAKIKELIYSKDNEIRSVKIEYEDGFCTRRAVNHLYPIEEGNVDFESASDQEKTNQMVNLHIQINKNEDKLLSINPQHLSHSFHSLQSSSPHSLSSCKTYQKFIMASKSNSKLSLSLEDISSGELSYSDSEKKKLQKERQETRKAESILRKELMVIKRLIEKMMEDHNKIILDGFKVTGDLNFHHELSNKLTQLNTKIAEAFKTRNELLVELDEVKKENRNIRKAFNKYVH